MQPEDYDDVRGGRYRTPLMDYATSKIDFLGEEILKSKTSNNKVLVVSMIAAASTAFLIRLSNVFGKKVEDFIEKVKWGC